MSPDHAPALQGVTLLLGSPFSGSSLLGQELNDIAGIAYAGEVDNMHRFGFPLHRASGHYRSRCEICATHPAYDCPVYPHEDGEVADATTVGIEDYVAVLSRFGEPFVVDGSKNVDWLWFLQARGLLDVLPTKVILVVRSVWAFAASQLRNGHPDAYQAAEGWRNIYRHSLRSIAALGVPCLLVRHEDFVGDADRWLSRAAWFVSGQPHNLHAPKPLHCVGGNPGAYALRPEFDPQRHLLVVSEQERSESSEKFAFFGGRVQADTTRRWAGRIDLRQAKNILAIPGVMDTMLDLGYDPLRILDEHAAQLAAAG